MSTTDHDDTALFTTERSLDHSSGAVISMLVPILTRIEVKILIIEISAFDSL
jgi:hypothetical protein